ncbi:MAG: hypothetical protein WBV11_00560 [Salegentibacter sp.]
MKKAIFTFLFFTAIFFQAAAQQDTISSENPVQSQFQDLIESSNNYQGYKVVDYDALIKLRNNTNQYVQQLKDEIVSKNNTLDSQNQKINDLQDELAATKENLQKVTEEKDAIKFLGMPFSKGSYMAMMWGIVALLVVALLFFIYRYKSSNATTKEANQRLRETEKEFDAYRAKALEKEQRLGRQLQDERNKANN